MCLDRLGGLPLASWASDVYKKLGGRWGCSVFTDMVNDGPLSHGKVCVLTESLHRVLESFKVSYRNRSYCITAIEFAYWAPNIESTEDKSMTDSLKRKDDEGPSLDGGLKHEEPLDVDNCDSVSSKDDNNDSDSSSDKAERLAHHNNGLDDLDISLRNRLLHQDKCRVRPVKAAVIDSIIVSSSTPPGTILNLAEESCSTWLDYVGPLITDELDSEKRWSYRDSDGNVKGRSLSRNYVCGKIIFLSILRFGVIMAT
nr:hypothetical protein [Tanacetum cinerariifolium]